MLLKLVGCSEVCSVNGPRNMDPGDCRDGNYDKAVTQLYSGLSILGIEELNADD